MIWEHPPCIAIDFETSGYYGASACALGMARIENTQVVDVFYSLVRPPSSRICFTHIHGLTWKDLKDQKRFALIWPGVEKFIAGAKYFVAHNAGFDRNVLLSCCRAFDLKMPEIPFLCTLKGSRKALDIGSYSLNTVCAYFGYEFNHHHAGEDAAACAHIFSKFVKMGYGPDDMLLK